MDIERKTCDIRTWKKTFISRHILHQHWYTCPNALPERRNLQLRNLLTVVSAISAPPFQHLRHQRNVCHQGGTALRDKHFPPQTRNTYLSISFALSPFAHKKSTSERHFDYWNQALNMGMRVFCLACHEAGLCCFLVTQIENLLRPLQLFDFHLWPVYWLSLVCPSR
jgi:hypothetical protein